MTNVRSVFKWDHHQHLLASIQIKQAPTQTNARFLSRLKGSDIFFQRITNKTCICIIWFNFNRCIVAHYSPY